MRIYTDKNDYDITLFCNRLNLDQLLKQLGEIESVGGGDLYGKIPVEYKNNKIKYQGIWENNKPITEKKLYNDIYKRFISKLEWAERYLKKHKVQVKKKIIRRAN